MKYYLAIDLGASSGRHIVGYIDQTGKLQTEEVYRFKNQMDEKDGHLIWNTDRLFKEIKAGIKIAFLKFPHLESIGIDTWGVDYALIDAEGRIIEPVYAYRDERTKISSMLVHKVIPFSFLYEKTGIQFETFNTIYQLYDDLKNGRLSQAKAFLLLPEYFNYLLSGVMKKEYTDESTTGLLNVQTKEYDQSIIKVLELPSNLFSVVCHPQEVVGPLKKEIIEEVGGNALVKLVPSHDTAAAFYASKAGSDSLILSSGTWSLMGIKTKEAINTKEALEASFSNEGGADSYLFIKNIVGLWLNVKLHEESGMDYEELEKASLISTYNEVFDVNNEVFLAPKNLKEAINSWFKERGLKLPLNDGDYARSIYRSLAYKYEETAENIEKITGKKYAKVTVIGGGAKNFALNHFMEEIMRREIVVNPIEATAIGNLISQISER